MQKKKSDNKISLPSVGIMKPTQNSKSYVSKANLNKCREVQQKNIYFQMPSIHQNDLTMKTFIDGEDKGIRKTRQKILKFFQNCKDNKMIQEWDLYIKKSQIINSRQSQFYEVEEFLVKNIYKFIIKLNQNQPLNTFSFNKTMRFNQIDSLDNKQSFAGTSLPQQYKTLLLQDRSLNDRDSKNQKYLYKSLLDERSKYQFSNLTEQAVADPINLLSQQNVILDKKANLFEKRIIQLQHQLSKFQTKQKQNIGQKDITNQLMTVITLKNKYKYDSQVKTLQIDTITQQLNTVKSLSITYKARLDQLQVAYSNCLQLNVEYKEYLKYKQLWLMSAEESNTWRVHCEQLRQQNVKLVSKVKMLKDKNKQLLNYFNMSNAVNPDQEQDKQDLDKIIKQFKEWLMIISVPKVSYNQPHLPATEQTQEQNNNTHINSNQVDIKLLRPNFYVFFQAYQNTLLMEKNIINIRPVQYNFFLKIRAIFDTMFNCFQTAASYKDYPAFPQYVIGFLQKYQVNPVTNLIEFRKKSIQNQQKITFLVNLFNKNFCNTWQCDIFKNFLFQNNTLDQVYFFLDCRNQINSGIPITNVFGATDPISYVKLSKALKIVGKKLSPYEGYIIERVKSILKNKKKVKYGQSFIDKNFVLKILLQVYSLQRSKSERVFQFSFKSKMKKSYITFGDFHNFMCKNFTFLSSIQIAQLYRQAYGLSSGHLTYKSIHYLCCIKGLFIPLLLAKRINKNSFDQSLNHDMLLLDIQNSLAKMSSQFQETGVQSLMRTQVSMNNFMRQLEWYKNNKSAFYRRLFAESTQILKINMLFSLKSSYELTPGETLEEAEVQNSMIQLRSLLHQTDTQVHLLIRQKEKRAKALGMLTRNFKIRIQDSMLEFQKINEDQVKKLRDQIQRTSQTKKPGDLEAMFSQTLPS